MLLLGLSFAVLSRGHPGNGSFANLDPEAGAGEVLPILDPNYFAIRSGLFFDVIATAVVGDLQYFHQKVVHL